MTRDLMVGMAIRARTLDDWVRTFIAANPDATVLHLGCGLDTHVFRVNPPRTIHWFDLDYPEVIALRRRLYPEREDYTLIGSSVVETGWLEQIPADRPTMVVAEGLTMYLRQEEVQRLFMAITARIPSGEAAFDAFSRFGVWAVQRQRSVRATGARLHWGIDDPRELEEMVPRLKFFAEVAAYDMAHAHRFSLPARLSIRLLMGIKPIRRIGRFLRYRF